MTVTRIFLAYRALKVFNRLFQALFEFNGRHKAELVLNLGDICQGFKDVAGADRQKFRLDGFANDLIEDRHEFKYGVVTAVGNVEDVVTTPAGTVLAASLVLEEETGLLRSLSPPCYRGQTPRSR